MRTGPVRELRRGCRRDAGAAQPDPRRRARTAACARRHRDASVEPLAGPAHHRHAALPSKRRAASLRRLAQQHLRPPSCTWGSPERTARSRCTTRCATSCPRCSRSRRARRSSNRSTRACTRRAPRSSPACSRAAASRTPTATGAGGRTTSRSSIGPARSPSTRRSGGASARIWRIRRSRSASQTASRISRRRNRSQRSATAWPSGAPARSTRGRRCRACRTACWRRTCGGRSDTACRASCSTSIAVSRCTRGRGSSSCSSGWRPSRVRSARRAFLNIPARNAAERQIARFDEGASLEEIYSEQVRIGEPAGSRSDG